MHAKTKYFKDSERFIFNYVFIRNWQFMDSMLSNQKKNKYFSYEIDFKHTSIVKIHYLW